VVAYLIKEEGEGLALGEPQLNALIDVHDLNG
jgi:hypothetical protein